MSDDSLIVFPTSAVDPKLRRAQSLVGSSAGKPEHEFYRTPDNAVEALLAVERFTGPIWEPACGDGAICRVLEAHGHTVSASDLIDRGYGETGHDFLTSDQTAENIITNPPFSLAQAFAEHALRRTTGKVALLCKLNFLEGQKRRVMFERTKLARVHVFAKRISMYRNGEQGAYSSSMIAFAWFVWEHGSVSPTIIDWV